MTKREKRNNEQQIFSSSKETEKTLDLLLTFLDCFPHLVLLADTENWKILFVNGLMAKSLGMKKEQLLGKNIWEILPDNVSSVRKNQALKAMRTGKAVHFKDQRGGRWFSNRYIPLKDKSGKVIYGATISEEITQQKNLEEQFQSFLDQSLMGVGIIQDDQVKYVNNAITIITGYDKEEILQGGVPLLKTIIHPDDVSYAIEQLRRKLHGETTEISQYPMRIQSKNRGFIWVEVFSKAIMYDGDDAAFITFIDITQLKQTEEELRQNEEKYRSIFNISLDGIITATSQAKIKDVNEAALHILGYMNKKELIGKNSSGFYALPDQYKDFCQQLHQKGYVRDLELLFKKKNGSTIYTMGSAVAKRNNKDKIEYIVGTFRDITQQKKITENIKKSQIFLQNVLDGTSELIFSLDDEKRVTSWNKSAVISTGYDKREVIDKSFTKLPVFKNHPELQHVFQSLMEGHSCSYDDLIFTTKFGVDLTIRPSYSLLKSSTNKPNGLIIVGRDVTQEMTLSSRLLPGYSYFIEDTSFSEAWTIFSNQLSTKNNGLFFSRKNNYKTLKHINKQNIRSVFLGKSIDKKREDCISLEHLEEKIIDFVQKNNDAVIFLDRMEYFILMSSFDSLVNTLYNINSIIASSTNILLVRINPNIIQGRELEILREEFEPIPHKTMKNIQIDDDLFNILQYIHKHTLMNRLLSYSNISKKFNITKITTAKRLSLLEHMGLISVKIRGRSKTIHMTDTGKNLLLNQEKIR